MTFTMIIMFGLSAHPMDGGTVAEKFPYGATTFSFDMK